MNNYKVIGMTCAVCSHTVERAVSAVEGVEKVNVNLLTGMMQVNGSATADSVIKAVRSAGYKARLISDNKDIDSNIEGEAATSDNDDFSVEDNKADTSVVMLRKVIISAVLLVILMYFTTGYRLFGYKLPEILMTNSMVLYAIEMAITLAVIVINSNFIVSGINAVIHRAPNVDALISLGAIAAFLYSSIVSIQNIMFYGNMREYVGKTDIYFETAALILTLVSIGKLIEEKAKIRTTQSLDGLIELAPKTALIMTSDGEKEVPIESVNIGDTFILKPGMSVPVDGIVKTGTSAVNEASLTGESIPVDKEPGMKVAASTINMSGYLTCSATSKADNTAFSQIVQMATDAANGKVNIAKTTDQYSGFIILGVLAISIVTLIVWLISGMGVGFAISRAVAVLIISCPCALGVSAPIALMAGNGVGVKHGILFKTAQALENAGKTNVVVVDKTGTITTGEPKVTDIIGTVSDIEHRDLLLMVAYSLESKSEHPLAKAICDYASKRYVSGLTTVNFMATPGKGVQGDILLDGEYHTVYAGNESFIAQSMFGMDESKSKEAFLESDFTKVIHKLVNEGKTPIIFATKRGLLGVIAVADEVKEGGARAIELFHKEDIHVVMVTGDRYVTAKAVADVVGIGRDEVLSEVLPKDKADIVEKLKNTGKVAMIGDGVNDAPALVCADTGIAIGAGTDVAVDAADVVLVKNDLVSAVDAVRLSKLILRITQQNLFWALIYNVIGIPLAAGCFYKAFGLTLNPIFCAMAMTASSLVAIANSLRIFKFEVSEHSEVTVNDADNN